jgi:hypothetical protein
MGLVLPRTLGTTPAGLRGRYQWLKKQEWYSLLWGVVSSPSLENVSRQFICRIPKIRCRQVLVPVGMIGVESLDERAG